mgnify:FL=1
MQEKRIQKILVPVDFSTEAANALLLADRFAQVHGAEIFLLNVVTVRDQMGISVPESETGYSQSRLEDVGRQLRHFVREILTRDVLDDHFWVVPGPVVEQIVHTAKTQQMDLIVIGTKGQGGSSQAWIGSTAADLLERTPCHVLLVPEKARQVRIEHAVCATDLQENDPYRIWKAANLLQGFAPVISCVHVHASHNGTFHISMDELRAFLTVTIPSVRLKFFEIVGITAWDSLNDFCGQHETDLLIVFKPFRGLLKTLFHTSVSRSLLLQSTVPMLVIR